MTEEGMFFVILGFALFALLVGLGISNMWR